MCLEGGGRRGIGQCASGDTRWSVLTGNVHQTLSGPGKSLQIVLFKEHFCDASVFHRMEPLA